MNSTLFSNPSMAGQRLMAGFDGTALNDELTFLIRELKVGGVILFARNLVDPGQIKDLCGAMQACARDSGRPPLLIAIDQEGGQVARLKAPFTQFPGNPAMQGPADAERFARTTAAELGSVGINMNLAPVLDVALAGADSIMAGRSFGSDPNWVARLGAVVIEHLQANGIMAVAKHFPGIGRTTTDSHLDLPALDSPLESLEQADLLPFAAAVSQNVAGIMLSHILYRRIDPQWPASLSATIADTLLRARLGFDGLVLTDDLDMGAIQKHYDIPTAVDRILAADIDIALICHAGPAIAQAYGVLQDRLGASTAMQARGKAAVQRILRMKSRYLSPEKHA